MVSSNLISLKTMHFFLLLIVVSLTYFLYGLTKSKNKQIETFQQVNTPTYRDVPNFASLTLPGVKLTFGKDRPCFDKINFNDPGTYPDVFKCPTNWGLSKPKCPKSNSDFVSLEGYNCNNFKEGDSSYCKIYGDTLFFGKTANTSCKTCC
jgi:hypothetical protein